MSQPLKIGKTKRHVTAVLGFVLIVIVLLFFTANLCKISKITVGIYQGRGTGNVPLIEDMFLLANCEVRLVDAKFINSSNLNGIDVLCIPGGNTWAYSEDISPTGKESIRSFVRAGGAYLGICAGGYFASEREIWIMAPKTPLQYLGLFPGIAQGPVPEIAPPHVAVQTRVNIVDSTHPIAQNVPDSLLMTYESGPKFLPNKNANVTILARYDLGNQPTIVVFDYGSGRVFIIGTHPEINPPRTLIKNAVRWLTEK